jgi:hypothetical protein
LNVQKQQLKGTPIYKIFTQWNLFELVFSFAKTEPDFIKTFAKIN